MMSLMKIKLEDVILKVPIKAHNTMVENMIHYHVYNN